MSDIQKRKIFTILLIAIPLVVSVKYGIAKEYCASGLWFLIALLYFIREVYKHIKYKKIKNEERRKENE